MKIAISKLTEKYKTALATSGASQKDIDGMLRLRLEQDFHHNYFSGISEIEESIKELRASTGVTHTVEVDKPAMKLVNCNGRAAGLVSLDLLPTLCEMAREQGIAMIGYYNGGYQNMPEVFVRAIAAEKLVGLVAASGGPQAVVPFGGSRDIMGTNPLAYGIPTKDLPIVFDAATSLYPYGAIKMHKEKGEPLPERSFLDKEGHWTTDPNVAIATIPFGGHKGYAINLLLEVMTGALVRAKSGLLQTSEADQGGFLIAIDPAAFGPYDEFLTQTTKLAEDIEATPPAEGYTEVRVPGYTGERYRQKIMAAGEIELDDAVWNKFEVVYDKLMASAGPASTKDKE